MVRYNMGNDNIRFGPRYAVMALPAVVGSHVFVLIGPGVLAIPRWFGVEPNAPFEWNLISLVAMVCALFFLVLSMSVAFLLGWILNGVILRFILGWPLEKVIGLLWYLETPPEWLKDDIDGTDNDDTEESEEES